jgi:hypothetical protein
MRKAEASPPHSKGRVARLGRRVLHVHEFLFGGGLGEFGSGAVGDRLQFLNGNPCAEFAGEGVVLWAASGIDRGG